MGMEVPEITRISNEKLKVDEIFTSVFSDLPVIIGTMDLLVSKEVFRPYDYQKTRTLTLLSLSLSLSKKDGLDSRRFNATIDIYMCSSPRTTFHQMLYTKRLHHCTTKISQFI